MTIILFLLVLSFLVIIHELGHFVTARKFKVHVEEFGIGYPPKARVLFHWKGIPFTLNWIPVGGFVRMSGEEQTTISTTIPHGWFPFYARPLWQRLIIILAGASVNFLFGVIAFTIFYSRVGIPVVKSPIQITRVDQGPALQAGVQNNDVLVSATVNGYTYKASQIEEFVGWIGRQRDENVTLNVVRSGSPVAIAVHTRSCSQIDATHGALGVQLDQDIEPVQYPWYQMPFRSMAEGIHQSVSFSGTIIHSLLYMAQDFVVCRKLPSDVAGPIGIVNQLGKQKVFSAGWLVVLNIMGMLSINLAILNVLPFPALDGGRAVLILLEAVVGRKHVARIEGAVNAFGFVCLLTLIALISLKDILSLLHQ